MDIREHYALSRAKNATDKVQMLVVQAQRLSPSTQALGPIQIANGHILGDVIIEDIFSDMQLHENIKRSQNQ